MRDFFALPPDLPVPEDDGACAHLTTLSLPDLSLPSTANRSVNLRAETQKPSVIFFYPRTGEPDKPAAEDWDRVPGARGCTPQSCGFRDLNDEFKKLGYAIFGASSQSTSYQKEFVARNHMPFEFLSDENFLLCEALKLPTFEYHGLRLIKRLALVVAQAKIEKVFYPVFPPHKNAESVLTWLQNLRTANGESAI